MGMLVRDDKWWKNNVYGDAQIAVYFNENAEAKGYLLYNIKERKMDVQELVYVNNEARCGLWNFICQHDSMVEEVTILTSTHENLPFILHQPKVKMEVSPYFMARIVDVEKCLDKYQFQSGPEKVFLHIEDSYAPWNNGSYLIGNSELKVFKEKQGSNCVQPPQRGIRIDINSLAAILFGYKRPLELYEMGYLKGSEMEAAIFEKLVPLNKPYFYDFF
jgi:predicted acetyltransferase